MNRTHLIRQIAMVGLLGACLALSSCIQGATPAPDPCAAVKQLTTPAEYAALVEKKAAFALRMEMREQLADHMQLPLLAAE